MLVPTIWCWKWTLSPKLTILDVVSLAIIKYLELVVIILARVFFGYLLSIICSILISTICLTTEFDSTNPTHQI